MVNKFISIPRDKSSLNCAVFIAGIIEAVLTGTGFVSIFPIKGLFQQLLLVLFSQLKYQRIGIKVQLI